MAKSPARQSYLYKGPVTPLEVPGHETKMLFPGTSYRDLPTDSDIVKNLIARKLLIAEDLSATAGAATPVTTTLTEGA